jgi:two-component system, OmpR family, sensor kinase
MRGASFIPNVTIPFGLRALFRLAFLLLAGTIIALAISVLIEEKQRSFQNYSASLAKTHAQIIARLRNPAGQLLLLNPSLAQQPSTPVRPLLLPYGALDFDDRTKARQAAESAGCGLQYPDGASLCAGIGNNPYAGAFIYLLGSFQSGPLIPLPTMNFELRSAHRMLVSVQVDQQRYSWIAPFQTLLDGTSVNPDRPGIRGRLTGYDPELTFGHGSKFDREFRAWVWQDGDCAGQPTPCSLRTQYSIRVPIAAFRDAIQEQRSTARAPITWPPIALAKTTVTVQAFAPTDAFASDQAKPTALFDSDTPGASSAVGVDELKDLLQPGERLSISKVGSSSKILELGSNQIEADLAPAWLDQLITGLPLLAVDSLSAKGSSYALAASDKIVTPLGQYEVNMQGDPKLVNERLAQVTQRISRYLWALLGMLALVWLALEWMIIRRITVLTKRAASLATSVKGSEAITSVEFQDLRGRDELGLLSTSLQSLFQRVKEDVRKDQIRAEQEKDSWQAVGHEIMSPLQSLMVLHPKQSDPSHRYISRMQQAVKILYGSASPADAIRAATPDLQVLDLSVFLQAVAQNSESIGIGQVSYTGASSTVLIHADEHWLEDALGHLLNNAAQHRLSGTLIQISLALVTTSQNAIQAEVSVSNQGAPIATELLGRVFEYGVSSKPGSQKPDGQVSNRGQGLFVVKTYVAKMAGTIVARNSANGVTFTLTFPLAQTDGYT